MMVSVTISLQDKTLERIERFPWINWSEIAREEIAKKEIFERFIKANVLTKQDQEFCDKLDWHPVDDLPLKQEFVDRLKKLSKKKAGKAMSVSEFNSWCKSL